MKGNLKIALCSWESLHTISVGGVAPHVTELAAALQRRGHEVRGLNVCYKNRVSDVLDHSLLTFESRMLSCL